MNDDLARLKSALHANAPQASAAVREEAISAAKEQFNLHNQVGSTSDDELEMLKSAFHNTAPQAPEAVREQAISAAREKYNRRTKGKGNEKRLMDKALKFSAFHSYIRRLVMHFSRPSLAFVGSVVALAIGIVSYQMVVTTHPPLQEQKFFTEPAEILATAPEVMNNSAQLGDSILSESLRLELAEPEASVRTQSLERRAQEKIMRSYESNTVSGAAGLSMILEPSMIYDEYRSQARFTEFNSNRVKLVVDEPVSTFSIDVDTTSYTFLRAMLNQGIVPSRMRFVPKNLSTTSLTTTLRLTGTTNHSPHMSL